MYEEYDSCDFFFFFFSSPFLGACAGAERSEAENVRSRERFFRRRAVSAARAPAGRRPDEARGRARGGRGGAERFSPQRWSERSRASSGRVEVSSPWLISLKESSPCC